MTDTPLTLPARIRVTRTSDEKFWYNDQLDQEFDVLEEHSYSYLVKRPGLAKKDQRYHVQKTDCVAVVPAPAEAKTTKPESTKPKASAPPAAEPKKNNNEAKKPDEAKKAAAPKAKGKKADGENPKEA